MNNNNKNATPKPKKTLLKCSSVEIVKPDLLRAAIRNNLAMVKVCLQSKHVRVNKMDGYGETALIIASELGHYEIVEALLNNKANIEAESNAGKTPLMAAIGLYELRRGAQVCHPQIIRLLLDHGAKPDHRTDYGHPVKLAMAKMEALDVFVMKRIPLLSTEMMTSCGFGASDIDKVLKCRMRLNSMGHNVQI